ncbi:hypothetical protein [Helicobacter pylori]|uniref:hypothetical protein n=1 Tax=Helicobacter pylori TaxID=210 RepID=UPI002647765A|nr:hypothetical protein [Helicobacter pylori]MCQ2939920.1 hypothetical protein [Helicobacter pylori]
MITQKKIVKIIKEKIIKEKIKEEETIKKEKIKEKIKGAFDEKLPKKPPIDLRMTFGYNPYWISIISNVDSITILSTKINRGDCANNDGFPYFEINKTLKFGDSYQFYIPFRCRHIKEVSIKTDKGTWDFTFARK